MTIEQTAEKIITTFANYTHGVRVQMLINRGIGNTNKGSKRWVSKLISTNQEEFHANIIKLLQMQYYLDNPDVRLYSCVNPRNMEKAFVAFQVKMLTVSFLDREQFCKNIHDKFISCLMSPEHRDSSLFLIDHDDKENYQFLENALQNHLIRNVFKYETPNGYHYVTEGFNPVFIEGIANCEIKRDALLLLHVMEKK